ncbi:MAG TPA: MBL fold metallo-hydrolase [Longimicrobiaceae bacterium]|nr:MBL fold metallo-hydrolase [Longimicrobiaceae bacterium]
MTGGLPPAAPVAPDLWRIPTPMPFRPREVHTYLARVGGDAWMLVDGGLGTDEAWAALDAGVRGAAGGWEAVRLHVVTHMHMDHVGLAARAREASGAPVLMGRLDAERMAHAAAHPDDEAGYRLGLLRRCGAPAEAVEAMEGVRKQAQPLAPPVAVDAVLDGAEGEVPDAPGWRWVWTPGHTAGHVSLFRPADAVLVAGDAVLPRITPTLGVNRQRSDPVGDYLHALARLEALRPALILPGHGEPPEDPSGRLAELRAAAEGETATVEALLGPGPRTAWEVVEARYPERELPAPTRMLALRETLAHLDRLAAAGRVRVDEDGGAARFSRG